MRREIVLQERSSTDDGSVGFGSASFVSAVPTSAKKKPPPASISSAAKRPKMINLMDDETKDAFVELANSKSKLAQINVERQMLDLQVHRFQQLAAIREQYPGITREQIAQYFPSLKDVAKDF